MLADKKIIKVEVSKEHLKTLNEASTLLISCVDFRLIDETDKLMKQLGLEDDFDKVSLPPHLPLLMRNIPIGEKL